MDGHVFGTLGKKTGGGGVGWNRGCGGGWFLRALWWWVQVEPIKKGPLVGCLETMSGMSHTTFITMKLRIPFLNNQDFYRKSVFFLPQLGEDD